MVILDVLESLCICRALELEWPRSKAVSISPKRRLYSQAALAQSEPIQFLKGLPIFDLYKQPLYPPPLSVVESINPSWPSKATGHPSRGPLSETL